MTTTRYFEEQVLRKRPYLQREWCEDGTTVHNAFPDRDFPVAGDEPDLS